MNDQLLIELKKMNKFLEAIDWKLWNLHTKYASNDVPATTQTVDSATAHTTQSPVETETPVVLVPKYPSIEEWK